MTTRTTTTRTTTPRTTTTGAPIYVNRGKALRRLAQTARTPTAPFHEHRVLRRIRDQVTRWGLPVVADAFGNVRVVYENPPPGAAGDAMREAPFVVVAHTDHPGFEVVGRDAKGRVEALWMGGVRPPYFRNAPVSIFARHEVRGVIDEVVFGEEHRVERIFVRTPSALPKPGDFGAFDLPDFRVANGDKRAEGRALDDLAGVAVLLSAAQALAEQQPEGVLWLLFTRAEEVGFVGAEAACREGYLPRAARLVSLETSAEMGGARQGEGPVIRVGDRASVYDTTTVAALTAVAQEMADAKRPRFRFQRALMSGGACEATLFARRGYATGGLAVALRNYHNMPPHKAGTRKRGAPGLGPQEAGQRGLRPEAIHTDDYYGMARLVANLATRGYDHADRIARDADPLGERLRKAGDRWLDKLKETAGGPASPALP